MLCEIYVEGLLVNEELADQVWKLWYVGLVSDELAAVAWLVISQEKWAMPRPICGADPTKS